MPQPISTQPDSAHSERFASIQYLRGIAATMIVLYHSRGPLRHLGYAGHWPDAGVLSGVDLFFVISGLVMWITTYRRTSSPLEFYGKRIVRIVPLYWVMTAVVLAILLWVPSAVQSGRLVASHVIASFLFLPAVHPVTGLIQPLLIPGWTLNEEMYFYALFGICLLLPAKARIWATCLLLSVPIVLRHILVHPDLAVQFFGNSVVLDFGLGLALGAALTSGLRLPVAAAIGLLAAGVGLLALLQSGGPHVLVTGVPALAVVAGLLALELAGRLPAIPLLALVGDASYSLYLSHTLTLSALDQLARAMGLRAAGVFAMLGAEFLLLLVTVLVGILVYRCIEQPMASLVVRGQRRAQNAAH
jgi:peptidoglycan/LPS O-acetylase OafA/YrhL